MYGSLGRADGRADECICPETLPSLQIHLLEGLKQKFFLEFGVENFLILAAHDSESFSCILTGISGISKFVK